MVVGGSQRLLSLNPTTVIVVLLLGLWLLLGCDKKAKDKKQKGKTENQKAESKKQKAKTKNQKPKTKNQKAKNRK